MSTKFRAILLLFLIVCAIFSVEMASARRARGVRTGGRTRSRSRNQEEPIDDATDGEPVPPEEGDYKYKRGNTEEEIPEEEIKDGKYEDAPEDEYYDEKGNKIKIDKKTKHHFDSKDFDDQERHPIDEEDVTAGNYSDKNVTLHNILYEDLMQSNCQVERLNKGLERLVISFENIKFPGGVTFVASVRTANELWRFDKVSPTPFVTNKYYYVSLNKSNNVHVIIIPKILNNSFHEIIVRPVYIKTNIIMTDKDAFKNLNPNVKSEFDDVWDDLVKRVSFRTGKEDEQCNKDLLVDYEIYKKLLEEKNKANETEFMKHFSIGERFHNLRKHATLNDFNPAFLTLDFRKAIMQKNFKKVMSKVSKSVLKFTNVFENDFLKNLKSELANARSLHKEGLIKLTPPKSNHKDGFILSELGLDHIFEVFFHNWLGNITSTVPPFYTMCGDMLDKMDAYILRYTPGSTDSELRDHIDKSDITFNLCLHNDDKQGSGIVFTGADNDKSRVKDKATVYLKQGEGVLHIGQNWHHTTKVKSGEKIHLLMFFTSTYCQESPKQIYFNDCDGLMTYEKEKCEAFKTDL